MDAVTGEMVQDVIERRPIHQGHQRFGDRLGQGTEPRALTPDQHDRLHPANLPLIQATSARTRSAIHAIGNVSFRHPTARCLR